VVGHHRLLVLLASVCSAGTGLAPPVADLKFTLLYQNHQLPIPFLDMVLYIPILLAMNVQESRHQDNALDLAVVVPVVEELIQPVAGLLGLGHEQEMMPELLAARLLDVVERKAR
jgi:hypothetical protein